MNQKPLSMRFPSESDIPDRFRIDPVHQRKYLIGGELKTWNGPVHEVVSPVHVRTDGGDLSAYRIGSYPVMTEREAMDALDAAVRAFDGGSGPWPTARLRDRIAAVESFLARMEAKRRDITLLMMWEIGKSIADCEKEFDRTVAYLRDTIDAARELDRSTAPIIEQDSIIGRIRRTPVGIVLAMGPFNYPLNCTLVLLIPALLMGNAVIMKPPRMGVLLFEPLLEAFRDCFPPGIAGTVYGEGDEVVRPLMQSGAIDVLAFIGTSKVANILKRHHPRPNRLRSVLDLGAKNPAIVLPDADLDLAVRECLQGSLSFNGQRCTALKILFVHRSIAETFTKRFCDGVSGMEMGMPWEPGVAITPVPEPAKTEYLLGLVEDARAHGAQVMNPCGGRAELTLFSPAVLFPVDSRMRVYHEEQFGPVVPIVPFDTIEEPLRWVKESAFGQQASIFGRDPAELARLIDPLVNQVCRVNLNCACQRQPDTFPFNGRKDSGEGTLSVSDTLRMFSLRSVVAGRDNTASRDLLDDIGRAGQSRFLSND